MLRIASRLQPFRSSIRLLATTSMADLAAYEQRAVEAEGLVSTLTQQVADLRAKVESDRLAHILKTNEELKQKVASAKRALRETELTNGKLQVIIPNDAISEEFATRYAATTGTAPKAAPVESKPVGDKPAETQPKVSKPEQAAQAASDNQSAKKKKPKDKKAAAPAATDVPDIARVNFIVGLITEAKMHPDADSLYVETIDIGEPEPRTVISGLAKYVPLEQMQNRLIVLCANLKPRKMRGVLSQGMVMCASDKDNDKVMPIAPPAGAKAGDVITFEGYTRQPDAVLPPKKKIYEAVAPNLKTNDAGVATYQGIPFVVEGKGECVAAGMLNVPVQ